jgi:hypothetical protein
MACQYPVFIIDQHRVGKTKALNGIGDLLYLNPGVRSGVAGKGLELDDGPVGNFSFGGCDNGHGKPFVIRFPL